MARHRDSTNRMREIRTSGSMSGEGKRSDAERPKPPRPSSTLLKSHLTHGYLLSKRLPCSLYYMICCRYNGFARDIVCAKD